MALSTINATIFTGARVYHPLGLDGPQLALLGASNDRGETPARALALQRGSALGWVVFGAMTENGTAAMVAYTARVFWLFKMLSVTGLVVLRPCDSERVRRFSVPL